MKFWIVWTIDAITSAIIIFYFLNGLATGLVSSFNIGIWVAILAVLAVVMTGSLWLKSVGRPKLAMVLLLVLVVPVIISAIILLLVIVSGSRWN